MNSFSENALILVAVLPNIRDFEIARMLGWYRIPLRMAPKIVDVDYIAFYQTGSFDDPHRWVIEHFAEVRGHELTTRAELLRMGTRVKMAAPIMDRTRPLGLMCVDWMDACEPARDERWARFEEIAAVVLGPVMSAAQRVASGAQRDVGRPVHGGDAIDLLESLTPAERTVARLAVDGLSYKEIARRLNRSFSTVDHQLRSARSKLGVSSTARLVNLMSGTRAH